MQSTTNYSMNLVEGTDLVNIPVQLNPNFQTVDAEMFKNKQSGIGTATEVVTGTVHAVVRSNTDADMFRFTATGAWTAGDTMTLDGSAVTVHLADGTAPATGAYIIGAEVVAVVNGSLVTLLTSAAQPVAGVTSFNSRTGAVVPTSSDYDASMVDYDNTLSGLSSTDVQGAIDEIAGLGLTEVWSNPDTSLPFSPDTISFADNGYKMIFVASAGAPFFAFPIDGSTNYVTTTGASSSVGQVTARYRDFIVSKSGSNVNVAIGHANMFSIATYGSAATVSENDTQLVPIRIYAK